MSFKHKIRKVLRCLFLGGGSLLGIQMSRQQIEELLCSMNQPRAEETVSDENEKPTSTQTGQGSGQATTQRNATRRK